jgi:hypothetical protein
MPKIISKPKIKTIRCREFTNDFTLSSCRPPSYQQRQG